jgi:hypothetical protein
MLFQVAEISTLQKFRVLYAENRYKSRLLLRYFNIINVCYIEILKLFSNTSRVKEKFFSTKISLVGYNLYTRLYNLYTKLYNLYTRLSLYFQVLDLPPVLSII